jgi:hypothetical protein
MLSGRRARWAGVAGGPLADDVIKCTLEPVDPADARRVKPHALKWTVARSR